MARRPLSRTLGDVRSLRSLLTLGDLELHLVAFLQALVSLRSDRAVVNEDVRSIGAPNETVAFRVIEPLDGSFQSFHTPLFLHILRGGPGRARS